jgi:hypothetical protein
MSIDRRYRLMSARALPLVLITGCVALTGCEAKMTVNLAAAKYGSVDQVNLAIDGVDLLDSDSSNHAEDSDADSVLNVLDYTDGDTATLLDSDKIAQGRYTGLRLRFADGGSYVETSAGAVYPIDIGNALTYADMDVDLGKKDSITQTVVLETRFSLYPSTTVTGHYTLTPVLRVVYTDRSGSIAGTVDEALVRSTACQQGRTVGTGVAVYAFNGSNVTPQDYVQNVGTSPVASADVVVSSDSTTFTYSFPMMTAGNYTLAVTCNADSENPTTNDGLTFLAQASVVLSEGESQTVTLAQ